MKKYAVIMTAILIVFSSLFLGGQTATAKDAKILSFDTMVGNTQAFTGAQNPIRGIDGGGIPWVLRSAQGDLSTSGRLEIKVRGLVLATGIYAGMNPVSSFRAIVSCLTADGSVQNVMTGTFPATTGPASQGGGNAKIDARLSLPHPCIAPIIFITSPTGAWFASTGN